MNDGPLAVAKSCFNFTRVDEPLLAELTGLTSRSIPGWRDRAVAVDAERSRR